MSKYYDGWRPYVSVAQRRANALREMNKLRKKGAVIEPVQIEGRTIARSFWGKGWCTHLESFGDYSNRLPRGRTHARNGSVCHLHIAKGQVEAIVSGSELYDIQVTITPLKKARWEKLKKQCTGKIGSLIELLQGKLSDEIMGIVTDRKEGMFPQPGEISYQCNCPDWAGMCKHIAAVIYGIGARLDTKPELLFQLRGIDHQELITADAATGAITGSGSKRSRRRSLAGKELRNVFGVDLEDRPEKPEPSKTARKKTVKRKAAKKATAKKATAKKATAKKATAKKATAKKATPRKATPRKATPRKAGAKKTSSKKTAEPRASKRPVKKKTAKRAPAPFRPTAAAVARLRRRLAMSKAEFARAIGVSPATVTNWENASGAIRPQTRGLVALNRLHRQK
jgi:uncharacterized Zn finger protein